MMDLDPVEKKLLLLLRSGPLNMSMIPTYLRTDYSKVLSIRKKLEQEGLLRVRRVGRSKLLELTEDGERVANEIQSKIRTELSNYSKNLHHHKILFASALTDSGVDWDYFELVIRGGMVQVRVEVDDKEYEFEVPLLNTEKAIEKYHEIARKIKSQIG